MIIIKPKYQYILLPLHYGLITLIAIINFIQLNKYKDILKIMITCFCVSIVFGLILYEIILENFNISILGISLRIVYIELVNIITGYYIISKQKKVLINDDDRNIKNN